MKYLQLIRIHQWIKNTFLFMPVFFGGLLNNYSVVGFVSIGFLVFSLTASVVYIFNDFLDIEKDKIHPTKSKRPLAAGTIPPKTAFFIAFILLSIAFPAAYFLNINFFLIIIGYFLMNLLYSKYLKKVPLIDVCIIAIGFLFRIFAGSTITGIILSKWLVIMTFLLALFLALAKRREDVLLLQKQNIQVRVAIKGYNLEFINAAMVMMAAVIVVAYLMYSISPEVSNRLHHEYAYFPVFWIIIGILRYFQLTFVEEQSGDPTKVLLKDKIIFFVVISWLLTNFFLIYIY